jgi:hypothetical protein
MSFKRNSCPIILALGNIKGLDIRRRDGNGWWEARDVGAGNTISGPFEASPVWSGRLLVHWKARKQTAGHQFSTAKQSVMMSSSLNSRKGDPAQGIGELKGISIDQSVEHPGRLLHCTSMGSGGTCTRLRNRSMAPCGVHSGCLHAPRLGVS